MPLSSREPAPEARVPERPAPRPPVRPASERPALWPALTSLRRFDTHRLLPAKYSPNYESVLGRIANDDAHLQLIFELDNATNARLQAEEGLRPGISPRELVFHVPNYRIINAAFTHPNPLGARFSTPERGAWYAAFELATAKAEVLFHKNIEFAEISWTEREELQYDDYLADFSATFHDLRAQSTAGISLQAAAEQAELAQQLEMNPGISPGANSGADEAADLPALDRDQVLSPVSYVASQQLTVRLLQAGSLGIVYPSVRRPGGTCLACFRPSIVSNVRKSTRFTLVWTPARARFLRQGL